MSTTSSFGSFSSSEKKASTPPQRTPPYFEKKPSTPPLNLTKLGAEIEQISKKLNWNRKLDYEINEFLPFRKGSIGIVYKVETDDGPVAVKQILIKKKKSLQLSEFAQEALSLQLISQTCPEYIAKYLDVVWDNSNEILSFISEWIDGKTLEKLIRRNSLNSAEKLKIVNHLIKGLTCIHAQNVLHRDIKSDNIMVPKNGKRPAVFIDFGLSCFDAKVPDFGQSCSDTRGSGAAVYWSPEIWKNDDTQPRTKKDDIYALGVIVLEILVGDLEHEPIVNAADENKLPKILKVLQEYLEKDYGNLDANEQILVSYIKSMMAFDQKDRNLPETLKAPFELPPSASEPKSQKKPASPTKSKRAKLEYTKKQLIDFCEEYNKDKPKNEQIYFAKTWPPKKLIETCAPQVIAAIEKGELDLPRRPKKTRKETVVLDEVKTPIEETSGKPVTSDKKELPPPVKSPKRRRGNRPDCTSKRQWGLDLPDADGNCPPSFHKLELDEFKQHCCWGVDRQQFDELYEQYNRLHEEWKQADRKQKLKLTKKMKAIKAVLTGKDATDKKSSFQSAKIADAVKDIIEESPQKSDAAIIEELKHSTPELQTEQNEEFIKAVSAEIRKTPPSKLPPSFFVEELSRARKMELPSSSPSPRLKMDLPSFSSSTSTPILQAPLLNVPTTPESEKAKRIIRRLLNDGTNIKQVKQALNEASIQLSGKEMVQLWLDLKRENKYEQSIEKLIDGVLETSLVEGKSMTALFDEMFDTSKKASAPVASTKNDSDMDELFDHLFDPSTSYSKVEDELFSSQALDPISAENVADIQCYDAIRSYLWKHRIGTTSQSDINELLEQWFPLAHQMYSQDLNSVQCEQRLRDLLSIVAEGMNLIKVR